MAELDKAQIRSDFHEAVNMTPREIEEWLETRESRAVGQKKTPGSESVGHRSGRRIVALLRTTVADLDDDDYAHMRKVVGYVRRHGAQEPANTVTSPWRYSLKNWGHDPLKG